MAADYRDKVVKETRFCLTLPAWLEAGAQVDGILVCLREPIAVAQSLHKRNKSTIGHGLRLWLTHNQRLLDAAGDIPVRLISFARLLDPATFAAEIGAAFRFFQLNAPAERIQEFGKTVVKPDLNHSQNQKTNYPPAIAKLWDDLCQRHAVQSSSEHPHVDRQACS